MNALTRLLVGDQPDQEDVVALLELDELAFADVVADALGSKDEEDWFVLLSPPVRTRTRKAIGHLRQATERHVAAMAGERRYAAMGAQKAMDREAERRIHQAEHLKRSEHQALMAATKRHERDAVMQLAVAVQRHRLASAGYEAEPHDLLLWSALESTTVPGNDGDEVTLAALLETGKWADEIAKGAS